MLSAAAGAFALWVPGARAVAQRADQNAVTAAADAFGTTTGYQAVGLYSLSDARGFNPQQAGNLRFEGLYFDMPSMYLNPCLVSTTSMKIGIAAQSYSFPAPTGIVDVSLATPDGTPGASAVLNAGSYGESGALIEGRGNLSAHVSGFACAAFNHNFFPDYARHAENASAATLWRWHPTERTDVRAFWSHQTGGAHAVFPVVYTDGLLPPPPFVSRDLATQEFTSQGWQLTEFGVILRQTFDEPWFLSLGLFRGEEYDRQDFYDEYLSVLPDRSVAHELDVAPALDALSTSGEGLLARRFGSGAHDRTLELMIRGRRASREFGGDGLFDYAPPVTLDSPPATEPAMWMTSAVGEDRTRQLDTGLQFEERWRSVGALGVGVLHSDYRRTVEQPGIAMETESVDTWLPSLRARFEATGTLTLYGSYLQGLEDSALAPSTAVNHGEPPPTTRSRQTDGGLRYAPNESTSIVFGAFEIEKSYFNLGTGNVYEALGTLRYRGLESSLTYADRGLTVVAGGVLLKPHVDRTLPEPGATGLVPLGPVPLVLNVNIDWAPASWHPWAASLQWKWLSSRVATTDDAYWLAPLGTLAAGVRYESKLREHPLSVRLEATNLTNTRGLHISTVEQVEPEPGRRFAIILAVDY
ncbi:MAG: TonB-dependent receptor [Gammaproteobacteria bacterium]|nr:TonB-dependent receptor [Gammaproteobacteria bacterium]